MPTYDYECSKCGHTFDAFQNMSDAPLKKCPECGKMGLKRLIGGGLGVIFKGSGFYVNDSRSSSKKSAGAKSGSAAAESTSTSDSKGSSDGGSGSGGSEKKSDSSSASKKSEKVAG
ncbi:MAG: FmdB family zinc ribbon protein [Spirochaetota bacterium]